MGWQDDPVVAGGDWKNDPVVAPAEKTGFGQTMAIGAGRTVDRLAAGLRDATPAPIRGAIDWANNKLGMGAPPSIDPAVQQQNTAIYEGAAKQHPAAAFIGEVAPAAMTVNPAALAGMGALEYGTPEERAARAAMGYAGGKVGQAVGAGASRMFGPQSASALPKLADEFFPQAAGNKWNIPLSVGQAGQSRPAQIMESVVSNLPGGAGVMGQARDATYGAFNRAIGHTFGEDTAKLTPEVLGAARQRAGGEIGDIAARNSMKIDEPFFNESLRIAQRAKTELTPEQAGVVVRQLDNIWRDGGKDMQLPGTLYKAYDSSLGALSKSSGGTLGSVLGDLRSTLRGAMDRSISPEDAAKWATARRQYLNLNTVANASKNAAGGFEDGVSPARLLQQVHADQSTAKFGSGNDLAELAQWAKKTLPEKIPNSGTAQRLFYQKLLENPLTTLGTMGGIGYGAEQTGVGAPEMAASVPAAYMVARLLAGKPTSATTEELLKRLGGGLLGAGALQYGQ